MSYVKLAFQSYLKRPFFSILFLNSVILHALCQLDVWKGFGSPFNTSFHTKCPYRHVVLVIILAGAWCYTRKNHTMCYQLTRPDYSVLQHKKRPATSIIYTCNYSLQYFIHSSNCTILEMSIRTVTIFFFLRNFNTAWSPWFVNQQKSAFVDIWSNRPVMFHTHRIRSVKFLWWSRCFRVSLTSNKVKNPNYSKAIECFFTKFIEFASGMNTTPWNRCCIN